MIDLFMEVRFAYHKYVKFWVSSTHFLKLWLLFCTGKSLETICIGLVEVTGAYPRNANFEEFGWKKSNFFDFNLITRA